MINNFINIINFKIKTKQRIFIIPFNKKIILILKKLIELNILINVIYINTYNLKLEINPSLFKKKKIYFKCFLKISNKQALTHSQIKQ